MKIQRISDRLDGKNNVIVDDKGLEIISDDGKPLYRLTLVDGILVVMSGDYCVHENKHLDEVICVQSLGSNKVAIERKVFDSSKLESTKG